MENHGFSFILPLISVPCGMQAAPEECQLPSDSDKKLRSLRNTTTAFLEPIRGLSCEAAKETESHSDQPATEQRRRSCPPGRAQGNRQREHQRKKTSTDLSGLEDPGWAMSLWDSGASPSPGGLDSPALFQVKPHPFTCCIGATLPQSCRDSREQDRALRTTRMSRRDDSLPRGTDTTLHLLLKNSHV